MKLTFKALITISICILLASAYGAPMKQKENTYGEVIKIGLGKTIIINGLVVKLIKLRPYAGDYTQGNKKSMVVLDIGSDGNNEEITVGEFSEAACLSSNQLFSVVSTDSHSATLRINRFTIQLDAGGISEDLKNIELSVKKPMQIGGLTIEVQDFFHQNEYGDHFSGTLIIKKGDDIFKGGIGHSFNYLNYHFNLETTDFSQAKLVVRPLQLGEQFVINKGQKIGFSKEDVSIELIDENESQRNQIDYLFEIKTADKSIDAKITQRYTSSHGNRDIPVGKIPYLNILGKVIRWKIFCSMTNLMLIQPTTL